MRMILVLFENYSKCAEWEGIASHYVLFFLFRSSKAAMLDMHLKWDWESEMQSGLMCWTDAWSKTHAKAPKHSCRRSSMQRLMVLLLLANRANFRTGVVVVGGHGIWSFCVRKNVNPHKGSHCNLFWKLLLWKWIANYLCCLFSLLKCHSLKHKMRELFDDVHCIYVISMDTEGCRMEAWPVASLLYTRLGIRRGYLHLLCLAKTSSLREVSGLAALVSSPNKTSQGNVCLSKPYLIFFFTLNKASHYFFKILVKSVVWNRCLA